MSDYITSAQARMICPDNKALYECCQRNQFILPPLRDALVTREFMEGAMRNEYWCLKAEHIHTYRVCADPPGKRELADMVCEAIANMNPVGEPMDSQLLRTAPLIRKKPPSVHWLLLVLCTLNENHPIFDRSYVHPKATRAVAVGAGFVRNPNGFFDGMPHVNRRVKTFIGFRDRENQEQQKLERLEAQAEKVNAQLALHRQNFNSSQRFPSQQHNPLASSQHRDAGMVSVVRPNGANLVMNSPSPQPGHPNLIGNAEELEHEHNSVANSFANHDDRQPLVEMPLMRNASP